MNPPGNANSPLLCNENPWNNNSNVIWLGSTLSLSRNIDKFAFPGKLTIAKLKQVISLLTRDLLQSDQLRKPKLLPAEEMSPIEKEFLVEHFISVLGFHQAQNGEAFILDQSGEFLGVINLRDHLMLQWIDTREDLEKTWERLVKLESTVSQSTNFAFSPKFGFLTSDPTRCGTGFIVNVFLHLPALIHANHLSEILEKNKDEGVEQTGLQGDPNEVIGDIVVFHNSYTLGLSEENILASLRTLATKLVAEERSLRKKLKTESESELAELKDKVSRAYAILLHSYQIESIEALQSISLLKLGFDLDWIKGTTQTILNELLFATRRAHLLCQSGQKIQQEELPHKRAEYIHRSLHGLELLI
jgi:protein arginine kinase